MSTSDVIDEFRDKVVHGDNPVFKSILGQLCSFRREGGKGMWHLKQEFK